MNDLILSVFAAIVQSSDHFSPIGFLGQFHPMVVHFPIALTLVAALAEALWLWTRRSTFEASARYLVALVAPAAVVTAALGLMAEESQDFPREMKSFVERHETMALTTTALLIGVLVFSELGRRNNPRLLWVYRALLFAAAITVSITGLFGGDLVYGPGHYIWPWSK